MNVLDIESFFMQTELDQSTLCIWSEKMEVPPVLDLDLKSQIVVSIDFIISVLILTKIIHSPAGKKPKKIKFIPALDGPASDENISVNIDSYLDVQKLGERHTSQPPLQLDIENENFDHLDSERTDALNAATEANLENPDIISNSVYADETGSPSSPPAGRMPLAGFKVRV